MLWLPMATKIKNGQNYGSSMVNTTVINGQLLFIPIIPIIPIINQLLSWLINP